MNMDIGFDLRLFLINLLSAYEEEKLANVDELRNFVDNMTNEELCKFTVGTFL